MLVPLLSSFYFGSVEHYRVLAQHDRVIIDIGEHYVRQSYRTRTGIVGPNGRQDLVVNIEHDHGRKMTMRDVRVSYSETWPQQHVHAIRSAYGKTPWFIHYIDAIETVVTTRHDRLVDLDLAAMRLCLDLLGISPVLAIRNDHVTATPDMLDLREVLHPKRPLPAGLVPVGPYPQVFSDRHGPMDRMSILDLLFNTGPRAMAYLMPLGPSG